MTCRFCKHEIKDVLLQRTCSCGRVWCCNFCANKHEFVHDSEIDVSLCRYCRPRVHLSNNCFWCEQLCKPATKDHVIPKHMGGKRVVTACESCNQERSIISSLYQNAIYAPGSTKFKDWGSLIDKYRVLIEAKLTGAEQLICLKELDKVASDLEISPQYKPLQFLYKL